MAGEFYRIIDRAQDDGGSLFQMGFFDRSRLSF